MTDERFREPLGRVRIVREGFSGKDADAGRVGDIDKRCTTLYGRYKPINRMIRGEFKVVELPAAETRSEDQPIKNMIQYRLAELMPDQICASSTELEKPKNPSWLRQSKIFWAYYLKGAIYRLCENNIKE